MSRFTLRGRFCWVLYRKIGKDKKSILYVIHVVQLFQSNLKKSSLGLRCSAIQTRLVQFYQLQFVTVTVIGMGYQTVSELQQPNKSQQC